MNNNYNYQNQSQEHEFGWDDEITQDKQEFIILPEGDYEFTVNKVVKGRFEGSAKMPACNRATLTLNVMYQGKEIPINHSLLLHSSVEWRLSEFFTALGIKKEGEPLRMRWNIEGMKGRCKIGHRTYNNETYNDVKKFYKPQENKQQFQQSQQSQQVKWNGNQGWV